jgi:NADH dehydrogenase
MSVHHRNLPRVVILGGGFAGLSAAKALRKTSARVTLLDRQNHHLFQPLLYQVATAALSPADIAAPLRGILRKQGNCEVIMADVTAVDPAAKKIVTSDGEVPFDYLIVATGARHHYFGKEQWESLAPGLKNLDDALEIRRRMLLAFELAEKTPNDALRNAAMTFVVVGGGPTGVEMAGAIAEIARHTLVRDFRHINAGEARVILVENSDRVLTVFVPELSASAQKQLIALGVDLRLGMSVTDLSPEGATLNSGEFIPAKTVVWAAGNKASPLGASLGVPMDRAGRVIVQPDLSIPGHPDIFVIGDLAHFAPEDGAPLPGLAPVAMQQGRHVAANIQQRMAGGWTKPFLYEDKGTMATIGRHAAVADAGFMRFTGLPAWLAWLFIHILFLVGYRSKFAVLLSWAYTYFVYGRKARLITGRLGA